MRPNVFRPIEQEFMALHDSWVINSFKCSKPETHQSPHPCVEKCEAASCSLKRSRKNGGAQTKSPVSWILPLRCTVTISCVIGAFLSDISDAESEPSTRQNYFLMESSTHNNRIQSNNQSPYSLKCE